MEEKITLTTPTEANITGEWQWIPLTGEEKIRHLGFAYGKPTGEAPKYARSMERID